MIVPIIENLISFFIEEEENQELLEWVGDWDPEEFNIEQVNEELADLGKRLQKKTTKK